MKVLFVCGGNSKFGISPIVKNQGESLRRNGVYIDYFPIRGRGFKGYLSNILPLREKIKKGKYDIIHAHYTLSGWTTILSLTKIPIVLSLMGSDTHGNYVGINKITFKSRLNILLTSMIQPFVKCLICKSEHIRDFVWQKKKSYVIPNGVLLEEVRYNKNGYRKELGLSPDKKYVLFLGSKTNTGKNYKVVEQATEYLNNIEVIAPYPVDHDIVVKYLNSVDVLVVPSFMEGSPNIIKEAMACNLPIVSTDVGDVKEVIGNTAGCYICSYDPKDVAEKIKMALDFGKRTNGRQRILELGLDSNSVANKVINVYRQILNAQ